ncbi:hypothetical protein ACWFMI_09965 [Nocardiopsis terrae]
MTATTMTPGVRRVLDSPHGRRFGRPGERLAAPQATQRPDRQPSREELMLAQMRGNPRVEHRLRHGDLPDWMHVAQHRKASRPEPAPVVPPVPRPRPAPDDGPAPGRSPSTPPRPSRPPLPRRPRRPASHRKPRRRTGWILTGYTLSAALGALAHNLSGLLG